MNHFNLQTYIEPVEGNSLLLEEHRFAERAEVIDTISFGLMDEPEALPGRGEGPARFRLLKQRAEGLMHRLQAVDERLFRRLQEDIRNGRYRGLEFKKMIAGYAGLNSGGNSLAEPGYDDLDLFVNGLFPIQALPEPSLELQPEMVYYQKTPARIILELVERCGISNSDIFYDIGAGPGQAVMLVNLLTGAEARGIEFEPAFCHSATEAAAALRLPGATFINTDARTADYADGTVFFMFTPFGGQMLEAVLGRLHQQTLHRSIKIATYGPCTAQVARQPWLHTYEPGDNYPEYKLCVFYG